MISKQKNVQIEGANGILMGCDIIYDPESMPQPVIIYAHGFNGFKDWGNMDGIAERFAQAGFAFVKFNFSHNGTGIESPEDFVNLELFAENNYSRELYDFGQVIRYIEHQAATYNIDASSIFLIGHSLGGGISIITAAKNLSVKALVTWASVIAMKTPWGSWTDEKILEWKNTGRAQIMNGRTKQQMPLNYQLHEDYRKHKDEFDIERAVRGLKIPMLICHGTRDEAVPVQAAYQLKEWEPDAELFIADTDHVFGRKHPMDSPGFPPVTLELIDRTIGFLKKHL